MFRGRFIPGELTAAGLLDRTLWVFRHRFYPYLLITITTYAPFAFVLITLYVTGTIELKVPEFYDMDKYIQTQILVFMLFFTLPALITDLACQHYTSQLVREKEIPWFRAILRALSVDLLSYMGLTVIKLPVTILISAFAIIMFFVPVIGGFVYIACIVTLFSWLFGMAPAIIVEDTKNIFRVIGRNADLGSKIFWKMSLAGSSGLIIVFAFMLSAVILFVLLSLLVMNIAFGSTEFLSDQDLTDTFLVNVLYMVVPVVLILVYIPLQSIYFSVLYYSARTKKEAFDLELRADLYRTGKEAKVQEDAAFAA